MLKRIFFFLSPLVSFTIKGKSMAPLFQEGATIIVGKTWLFPVRIGDTIALLHPHTRQFILKQVVRQTSTQVWVEGINRQESTDSRDFGWVKKKTIIGKVISSKS